MLSAVAPIWDGNETWLVVTGVVLWGAFPVVYATLLPAFYLPLLVMLAGLILRGVAFEFRSKTERARWIWDAAFRRRLVRRDVHPGHDRRRLRRRLPDRGAYTGGDFGWFSPFAAAVRRWAVPRLRAARRLLAGQEMRRRCPRDTPIVRYPISRLGCSVFWSSSSSTRWPKTSDHRWLERPYLFVFPAIGARQRLWRRQRPSPPGWMAVLYGRALIFISAFGTLAISFWPYMIPFVITIDDAAAPHSSLAFMFWGEGLFVFPLMLIYTAISYYVFRGKVRSTPEQY
jgi:cytochrome d ubiquinol oxidase subunit II